MEPTTQQGATCGGCDTVHPPALLACPACHRLTHSERLKTLAAEARAHSAAADSEAALRSWREALGLLPPSSRQYESIRTTIAELSGRGAATAAASETGENEAGENKSKLGRFAGMGAAGLLLWKLKSLLILLFTKGKLLLMGLTKVSTLFSMLLAMGVYWSIWGWKFALGFVLSIYVHEMGHVIALRRLGIDASAPMFIPGVGAFVRLKQYPASDAEDAEVGLAGPLWGVGAALVCLAVFFATEQPYFAAITRVGAWLNLFNLLPIWQLDGGRGFRALNKKQRLIASAVIGGMWLTSGEGLLLLLLLAAGVRSFAPKQTAKGDTRALITYCGLIIVCAQLMSLAVPGV